jgi:uncharacterized protein YceH (UPF0502 family)
MSYRERLHRELDMRHDYDIEQRVSKLEEEVEELKKRLRE